MLGGRLNVCALMLVAGLTSMTMLGCGDSEAPELSQPAKLTLVSGDAQSANGAALAAPLTVSLTDVKGRPITGAVISWSASDTSAALSATTSTTDATGIAQVNWTLGTSAGKQTVTATTASLPGSQVVFQANSGGVLTGGVTVQITPPMTIASTFSRASKPVSAVAAVSGSSFIANASRTSAFGKATRRLIVTFKAKGGALNAATHGPAIQTNLSVMRQALSAHLASKLVTRAEMSPALLAARVTVPAGGSVAAALTALKRDPAIASVKVDRIVQMIEPYRITPATDGGPGAARTNALAGAPIGTTPNDPRYPIQLWHYSMVDAQRVWKSNTTGSASVLVAVVDMGIRYDHESLPAGASTNLTHDGYNFVAPFDPYPVCGGGAAGEVGPGPDPTQPDNYSYDAFNDCLAREIIGAHGLHVSGTIGANGNDGIGVTGLNWRVSIRPVRVLNIAGGGSTFDVAQGILYAAGLPAASDTLGGTVTAPSRASVINMSLGFGFDDNVLHDAVIAATNAGSLIVASAGNSVGTTPFYPASYPEVLAVSAVGPDFSLTSYSSVGSNVSIAAPGGDYRLPDGTSGVFSSMWNFATNKSVYVWASGTSMAAPHVVGVAALVLAANPGMTNTQLRARLQSTAVHVGAPGRNDLYGYGIVNAYNAVTNTQGPARANYVRVVNATTGAAVQQVAAGTDGSYSVSRLPAGSYYVYGGQDESGDKLIGVPGRRFGWYGSAGGPTALTIGTGTNASASISIGTPKESKPHTTLATANRLTLNSYMVGQITATDGPAIFSFTAPATATYYFEAAGLLGTCGYGMELDTKLDLLNSAGAVLATNDDAGLPSTANPLAIPGGPFCSALSQAVTAGTTYYLRVSSSGFADVPSGQYRVWVRDTP